jgi:hypothetical protein
MTHPYPDVNPINARVQEKPTQMKNAWSLVMPQDL